MNALLRLYRWARPPRTPRRDPDRPVGSDSALAHAIAAHQIVHRLHLAADLRSGRMSQGLAEDLAGDALEAAEHLRTAASRLREEARAAAWIAAATPDDFQGAPDE